MWSHYSDNHKGFCLEYDVGSWPRRERRILYPVIYSGRLFDATKYILRSILSNDFENIYGIVAATHKSLDWEYEKEWRFVLPMGESFADRNYRVPSPSALYLGTRIGEENQDELKRIADEKGILVYKMQLSSTKFELCPKIIE